MKRSKSKAAKRPIILPPIKKLLTKPKPVAKGSARPTPTPKAVATQAAGSPQTAPRLTYALRPHTTVNLPIIEAEINAVAEDGWYLSQLIYPPTGTMPVSCWYMPNIPPEPPTLPPAPVITALSPPNGTTDVSEATDVMIATFDIPIAWGIAGGVYLRDGAGAVVEVLWNPTNKVEGAPAASKMAIIGNELHINFGPTLQLATGYWIGIDSATIKSFPGIYPSNVWAFATTGGVLPAGDLFHQRARIRKDKPIS